MYKVLSPLWYVLKLLYEFVHNDFNYKFNHFHFLTIQQKFKNEESTDSSVQQTGVAMLLVYAEMSDGQNVLIYCNNAKNSWRSFRPLRLKFLKETTATNLQEGEKLVGEMDKLAAKPYLPPAYPKVEVHFHGYLTMIDGKVTMEKIYQLKTNS